MQNIPTGLVASFIAAAFLAPTLVLSFQIVVRAVLGNAYGMVPTRQALNAP